jgi:hypothetical protein
MQAERCRVTATLLSHLFTAPEAEPERRQAMTWAQRLKRDFRIDVDKSAGQPICTVADCREAVGHRGMPDETCEYCGGAVRVIACIDDPGQARIESIWQSETCPLDIV